MIDRSTVLVGAVGAGARGAAAATRTGAAMLLNTRLDAQNVFKVVCKGQTSNAAGGYLIQVASVAEGAAIGTASAYATVAVIEAAGIGDVEVAVSGAAVRAAVKAAGSLTGDVRCVAVRATAGNGSNGAAVPAGTMTVFIQPDV
jgi:hypothetical protein